MIRDTRAPSPPCELLRDLRVFVVLENIFSRRSQVNLGTDPCERHANRAVRTTWVFSANCPATSSTLRFPRELFHKVPESAGTTQGPKSPGFLGPLRHGPGSVRFSKGAFSHVSQNPPSLAGFTRTLRVLRGFAVPPRFSYFSPTRPSRRNFGATPASCATGVTSKLQRVGERPQE